MIAFVAFMVQGLIGIVLWAGLVLTLYEAPKPREIVVYRCGKAYTAPQLPPRLKCSPTK
jgi:hypothetical protein